MRNRSRCTTVLALFGIALLVAGSAQADPFTDQVRAQLLLAGVALVNEGYELTDHYTGPLFRGRSETLSINLLGGVEYIFVAVCDEDCRDLDLYLYDENNNLIAKNEDLDDLPMVSVTPAWNGQFVVKVRMVSCSTEPCAYGLGTFRR